MRASLLAALWLIALVAVGCASSTQVPIWEQPPPPVVDSAIVEPGALSRYELDNGLSLILLEDHRLPRLSMGISVRHGSASEPLDRAGLARFTAELMKRGAGHRDALELANAIDEIGGSLSVAAGFDSISARVGGLSRDFDRLVEILSDVVLRPQLSPEEASRTRGELLGAMERAKDRPNYLERKYALATLYPNHRAGIMVGGDAETLAELDASAAAEFHGQLFVPNDAVFFASGDFVADEMLERIGAAFGAWTGGDVVASGLPMPSPVPAARKIVVVDMPELAQARITLIHEGLARTAPERIAASLLNAVIGGSGFSSRLMKRLRSDAGLTYGVSSGFGMRREGGTYSVSTFTRTAEVRRAIDMLLSELRRIRTEPPSQVELDSARARAVGGFQLGLETSDALLGALVDLDIHGLPEDSIDTYRSRLRAVSTGDLQQLADQLIHPDRAAIILVGPAADLIPQLEGLGPVEVVTP